MKRLFLLLFVATTLWASDEVYMANEAGGYLVLTDEACSLGKLKEQFPCSAYGTESTGTIHHGCYNVPLPPTAEETEQIPLGMEIIPVVNLLDLEDGSVYTLRIDLFTSEKPNTGIF